MNDNPYNDIFNNKPNADNKSELRPEHEAQFTTFIPNDVDSDVTQEVNNDITRDEIDTADSISVPQYNINYNKPAAQNFEGFPPEYVDSFETQPIYTPPTSPSPVSQDMNQPYSREWNSGASDAVSAVPSAPYAQPQPAPVRVRKKKEKRRMPTAVILLLCVILSVAFGTASAVLVNKYFDRTNQIVTSDGLTINQIDPKYYEKDGYADGGLATVDIVDMTADSVVEIITETVQTGSFAQQYIQSGAGSGVIIDREGYIATNHHVIDGARKITITLRSGDSYDATLIGSDPKKDLALLKIEAQNLTAAVFGDSDKLKVGQRTVAIGNPLGQLGGTVTEGILSALDRELVVDGQTMNLLQTDTAINPGNSGGGLFDAQGNLIGIVVAKSSGSEVEGLGFAVPANDVVDVVSDLMEYGYVRGRVSVGMEFLDVDSIPMAWMYGLSEPGCYVYSVNNGSSAASSGIQSGDLVVAVDGKEISTSDDIEAVLEGKAVGEQVTFTVKRSGRTGDITITLEEDVPISQGTQTDDSPQWYDFSEYNW